MFQGRSTIKFTVDITRTTCAAVKRETM